MNKEKPYHWLAIGLGILALIFAVLFITKKPEPIPNTLNQITINLEECRDKIVEWRSEHSTSTSTESARELESILSGCEGALKEGNEYLDQ
jgi:hypothetical protein